MLCECWHNTHIGVSEDLMRKVRLLFDYFIPRFSPSGYFRIQSLQTQTEAIHNLAGKVSRTKNLNVNGRGKIWHTFSQNDTKFSV